MLEQVRCLAAHPLAVNELGIHQLVQLFGHLLERLVAGGVTVLEFPESVWTAFGEASKETLEESIDDPLYKKVYDSMRASMKNTSAWLGIAENAYTTQRNRIWG